MIKIGIIGGAGYTSNELIKILNNHPWNKKYSKYYLSRNSNRRDTSKSYRWND